MMLSRVSMVGSLLMLCMMFYSGATKSESTSNPLYLIKIDFAAGTMMKQLTFKIDSPDGTYYSFYQGSDLPRWRKIPDKRMQRAFRPEELMNIRVHAGGKTLSQTSDYGPTTLTISDASAKRVIWQGKFYYDIKLQKMKVYPEVDNRKYYATKLRLERLVHTIWIESKDR